MERMNVAKGKTYHSLRDLPSISDVITSSKTKDILSIHSTKIVTDAARVCIDKVRTKLIETKEPQTVDLFFEIEKEIKEIEKIRPRRVINAAGIVLHTNMGRAPLAKKALNAALEASMGYSDLEFNVESGKRGSRQDHVEDIICQVTGAEACYVVNNNAAAVLLCLDTLACGKEAIVSRGELVEIGGAFRVPEVMNKSGAKLVEVGTTNKTKLADYQRAITDDTGILLKVHTSNFKIVGFTESVDLEDIVKLGAGEDIPSMYDLGSGLLTDLAALGYHDVSEHTVISAVKSGADIVTFSGDKLLGGPQCGIIVGKRKYIDLISKNQLARALRVDKLTLALLYSTLQIYLYSDDPTEEIPILKTLKRNVEELRNSARNILDRLKGDLDDRKVTIHIEEEVSEVGGGSLPGVEFAGICLKISGDFSACDLQDMLRANEVPIISYIRGDEVRLHLRTVSEDEMEDLTEGIRKALSILTKSV